MAVFLEVIDAAGNPTRLPVVDGRIDVTAQPGTIYRLVDQNGDPIGTGPRVLRVDSDLVITDLPEGQIVGITEFFSACSPADPCTLSLAELGGLADESITPASEPVAALQEGGFLMNRGAQGEQNVVAPEAERDINWKPIAAAGGGLVILGAVAGGGGGGGGDSDPPVAPTLTTSSVNNPKPVLEGQAEPNSRVTVTIDIGGSGNTVRYATTTDANGAWSVDLATDSPILGTLPDAGLPANESSPISLVATDSAGNASEGVTTSVVIDTTPPVAVATLVSVGDNLDPISGAITANGVTNDRTPTLSGTLSAALDEGDSVAVLRDGQVVGQATVTGTDFVFEDGPLADSNGQNEVTYTVQVRDAAGNTTAASAPFSFAVDATAPGAPTITSPAPGSTITAAQSQSGITVSGTTATSSDATTVSVTFGGVTQLATVDQNNAWTTTFATGQLPADGNRSISAHAIDAAGNEGADVASTTVTLDRTPPSVSMTSDAAGGPTNSPFTVTFVFSEPVTGFTAADLTVTGGTAGSVTGSGTTYSAVISPAAGLNGNAVVTVRENTVVDGSGNPNTAGSLNQPIDTVGPSLSITDNVAGTATGPVTFTFSFSEGVTGFSASDINVTGGTAGALNQVNSATYTMVVTPGSAASGTIGISVGNNAVTDTLGNPNSSASASQAYINDVTDPVLTITDNVSGNATGPVTFTFQFNEPVTGFTAGDISVSGGTAGTFTAVSATIYQLIVQPGTAATGTINVSVAAGAAQDAAGNPSEAASASQGFTNDLVDPVLTITDNATGTATGPVTFTFSFDEAVTGFTTADVQVTGGTASAVTTVNASTYQMVVTPPANDTGTLGVSVAAGAATDAAGNPSEADSATQAFDTDVDPTLTITNDAPTAVPARAPYDYTLTFSEPVTGLTLGDLNVSGGTLSGLSGSGAVYTVTVTPTDNTTGNISFSVDADAVQDAGGNGNAATSSTAVAFDREDPAPVITDNVAATIATGPVEFTIDFGEPVNGFTLADLNVSTNSATPLDDVSLAAGSSAGEFVLTVTPADADAGRITVALPAGAATDDAGNNSRAAVTRTQLYNTPTATDNDNSTASGDSGTALIITEQDLLATDPLLFSDGEQSSSGAADSSAAISTGAFNSALLPEQQQTGAF
ncbi:MAG: beta strand repeat-containing protein [Burkholderiaceae bacterium]